MKTTNFEISKKLKEIGFEAEFNFHYKATDPVNLYDSGYEDYKERNTPAYDLETLLEALPKINKQEYLLCSGGIVYLNDDYISVGKEKNESLADTAGKMWLLLKEKLGRKAS